MNKKEVNHISVDQYLCLYFANLSTFAANLGVKYNPEAAEVTQKCFDLIFQCHIIEI